MALRPKLRSTKFDCGEIMILVNYVITKSAVAINGFKAVKHNAIIVIKPRKFVFYYCLQGSLSSN